MKFVFLLLLTCNLLHSQIYFSKIIPFEHEGENINPNAFALEYYNNEILIANVYVGNKSTLTRIDLDGNVLENIVYSEFVFSKDPFSIIKNDLFLFAKDREIANNTRLKRLDSNYNEVFLNSYLNPGDSTFPLGSISIDSTIYTASITEFAQNNDVRAHIKKINTTGVVEWQQNIGEDYPIIFPYKLTHDSAFNLITASTAISSGNSRHSVVHKVNPDGAVEWVYESPEPSFLLRIESVIFTGDKIVLSNAVDRSDSLEFIVNDYHPYPPKITWLTNDGGFIKDTLFITDIETELFITDITKGRGGYFFVHGEWYDSSENKTYAWLVKMRDSGEVLWERKYQHPSFEIEYSHSLRDILELPSGDILLLLNANKLNEVSQIILAKVNENGCFSDETCDCLEIYTSTEEQGMESIVKVFPNPVSDYLTINIDYDAQLHIYDLNNRLVMTSSISPVFSKISVTSLIPGIYIYTLSQEEKRISNGSFIKKQ